MSISVKTFSANWLDNDHVHLVVGQPTPCSLDVMRSPAPRPEVLATLLDLLAGNRKLAQLVTGGRPAVVLFPELALAPEHWAPVDEAIRSYPSPVILICGFGVMTGAQLASWLSELPSQTSRDAVWTPETAPGSERNYNGGWCWVHQPDVGTSCIAFQKLTTEQREEIQIDSLDTGRNLLRIELDDLAIYPVICSDFFARVSGERMVAKKIKDHLAESAADTRKILVAGLLAQSKGHLEWRTAISDMARTINLDRVNVCLSNWAFDILKAEEQEDCWRDYSGVYLARERQASLVELSVVRRLQTDTVDGSVSRITEACVLGGAVGWAFGAAAKNIWSVTHGYLIEPDGSLQFPCCNDPSKYEFIRVVRRLHEPASVPAHAKMPGMIAGLESLKKHLRSTSLPTPSHVLQFLLFGRRAPQLMLTPDQLPTYLTELDQGSKILGILSLAPGVTWQQSAGSEGQLFLERDKTDLLVWRSPDFATTIWRAVDAWRQDIRQANSLVVIAKATGVAAPVPAISSRRTDIASTPPSTVRSVAEPRMRRRVIEVDMDQLSAHLHAPSLPECLNGVEAMLAAMTTGIRIP